MQHGEYSVTSLYFDTPTLHDYYAKLGGFSHRKKLRARIYQGRFTEGDDPVWLEVKEKHDMNIFKKRALVSRDAWNHFLKSKCPIQSGIFTQSRELNDFCFRYVREIYAPHIVVHYTRVVFEGHFLSDIRLTFDRNIETCKWKDYLYNGNYVPVKKNKTVLEIKFKDALPWWFNDMVTRFHLTRSAFSKYTNSVDAVYKHNPVPR